VVSRRPTGQRSDHCEAMAFGDSLDIAGDLHQIVILSKSSETIEAPPGGRLRTEMWSLRDMMSFPLDSTVAPLLSLRCPPTRGRTVLMAVCSAMNFFKGYLNAFGNPATQCKA